MPYPKPLSSEQLHNNNCYEYLKRVYIPPFLRPMLPTKLITGYDKCLESYHANYPYVDLHQQLFKYLDEHIHKIKANKNASIAELDQCILSLYVNDNHVLERTYQAIKPLTLAKTPYSAPLEQSIANAFTDTHPRVNQSQSPTEKGSNFAQCLAIIKHDYKPQYTTLSTIRHYETNKNSHITEYHFCTQGQRENNIVQVSPLFEYFLDAKARQCSEETNICHIYFNFLNRDTENYVAYKEQAFTKHLESLESKHKKTAFLTLPACFGLMDIGDYRKTEPKHPLEEVMRECLLIASQDPNAKQTIKDFYISQPIRKLLFQDTQGEYSLNVEKEKLQTLLAKSIDALKIHPGKILSSAERQALWFHFINFELINYTIETLSTDKKGHTKPISVNFACKYSIDRAGVASLYYNLIKSFEMSPTPMTREEFEEGLHAAPTMNKARGMNDHLMRIWNTVDSYVNCHYDNLNNDPNKAWLIEWRDVNCPPDCIGRELDNRVKQLLSDLQTKLTSPINARKRQSILMALGILNMIQSQGDIGFTSQQLLLQVATKTVAITLNPCKENLETYAEIANLLPVAYPTLTLLSGMMKTFLGAILYALSVGYFDETLKSGVSMVKSGWFFQARQDIHDKMLLMGQNTTKLNEPINEPFQLDLSFS